MTTPKIPGTLALNRLCPLLFALAFLLTGPATNLPTFGMLRRLHGKRVAILFGLVVGISAVLLGIGLDTLLPGLNPPDLHTLGLSESRPSEFDIAATGLRLLLFAAALVRYGPEGFLEPMAHPTTRMGAAVTATPMSMSTGRSRLPGPTASPELRAAPAFRPGRPCPGWRPSVGRPCPVRHPMIPAPAATRAISTITTSMRR